VLLEPIQAEIGAETPPAGYLAAARRICDEHGALLLVDEVRTGMGRTGPLFAVQDEQVVPDVLIAGKSLAGGIVPVGGILAHDGIWGRFGMSFSMSASSFAGNRLACAAALATLDAVEREDVLRAGVQAGETLRAALEGIAAEHPVLVERVTGRGLLLGLHLNNLAQVNRVVERCIEEGLLVASAFCNSRCVLLEPPLVIGPELLAEGIAILERVCREVAGAQQEPLRKDVAYLARKAGQHVAAV
jgi:putrescine aminotransferase